RAPPVRAGSCSPRESPNNNPPTVSKSPGPKGLEGVDLLDTDEHAVAGALVGETGAVAGGVDGPACGAVGAVVDGLDGDVAEIADDPRDVAVGGQVHAVGP